MNHISADHRYGSVKDISSVHALVELIHHWQLGLDVQEKSHESCSSTTARLLMQ